MTKVISLSNAAYTGMKMLKQSGESFSDVVQRLIRQQQPRPLEDFFGKWPGSTEEAASIKKLLEKDRKRFRLRDHALS